MPATNGVSGSPSKRIADEVEDLLAEHRPRTSPRKSALEQAGLSVSEYPGDLGYKAPGAPTTLFRMLPPQQKDSSGDRSECFRKRKRQFEYLKGYFGPDRSLWDDQVYENRLQDLITNAKPKNEARWQLRQTCETNMDVFRMKKSQRVEVRTTQCLDLVKGMEQCVDGPKPTMPRPELEELCVDSGELFHRYSYAKEVDAKALQAGWAMMRAVILWTHGLLRATEQGKTYVLALTVADSSYAVDSLRYVMWPVDEAWGETRFAWEMNLAVLKRVLSPFDGIVGLLEFYDLMVRSAYEKVPTIIKLYIDEAKDSSGQIYP